MCSEASAPSTNSTALTKKTLYSSHRRLVSKAMAARAMKFQRGGGLRPAVVLVHLVGALVVPQLGFFQFLAATLISVFFAL